MKKTTSTINLRIQCNVRFTYYYEKSSLYRVRVWRLNFELSPYLFDEIEYVVAFEVVCE